MWVRQMERQQLQMQHFDDSGRRTSLPRTRRLEAATKKLQGVGHKPTTVEGLQQEGQAGYSLEEFDTVVVQDQFWEATTEDETWLADASRLLVSSSAHGSKLGSVWDSEASE